MIPKQNLIPFLFAAVILIVTPGPAVLYIVTRSVDQGRFAGIVSVFGIVAGGLIHVLLTAFGISILFSASGIAFAFLRYLGAAYLVYLGLAVFRKRIQPKNNSDLSSDSLKTIFLQGLIVNLTNPKTILFFLAFLPQFTNPQNGSIAIQILILGIIFIIIAMLSDSIYALLAGQAGSWLKMHPKFPQYQKYFAAAIYCTLGVAAAIL